jgi:hypothetical protein
MMVRSVLGAVVLFCCSESSGGAACQEVPAITVDVVQEVACVGTQLLEGDDTFEGIAAACGPMALQDVVTIVGSLALQGSDGASATAVTLASRAKACHHRGATEAGSQ